MAADRDIDKARKYLVGDNKYEKQFGESGLKLYHVVLDGPPGVTYDGYVSGKDQDDAIEAALGTMTMLKHNDFNSTATEVQ